MRRYHAAKPRSIPPLAMAAAAFGAACTGCPPATHPETAEPRTELVLGTTFEPTTLDPMLAGPGAGAREVTRLLFRELLRFDTEWNVVPDLAAELPKRSTRNGRTVLRWTLGRHFWSDGTPVRARDVRFAWRLERNPKLDAANHPGALRVSDLRVLDAKRFEVVWSEPTWAAAVPRVHTVLPAHAYPELPEAGPFRGFGDEPVSNGPFRLERWIPGVKAVFAPNPHWPGPGPYLERVVFRFFQGAESLALALRAGEVDAVGEASGLGLEQVVELGRVLSDREAVVRPGALWLHAELRLDHPVLARRATRQAIARAVDREKMAQLVYAGAARPAWGLFPHPHPAHRAEGPGDWAKEVPFEGGDPRQLELQFAAGSPAAEAAAAVLGEALQGLGFQVRQRAHPFRTLFDRMERRVHGEVVVFAWRTRPDWDARSVLHETGRQNFSGYADPEVNRWLEAAESAKTSTAWVDQLQRVAERFRRDLPAIPLLFRDTASLKPVDLEGWRPTGTTTPVTATAEHWRWRPPPH
jgi:peptide/nickel transport system substrate-binding protein